MEKKFLSTGEINKKYDISLKTLRYYDQIGLLRPEKRNDQTGYRYYNADEILKLLAIKYFQDSHVSLEKIKSFFNAEDLPEIIAFFDEVIAEKEETIREELFAEENLIAWKNLVKEGLNYLKQKKIPFEIRKMRELKTMSKCTSVNNEGGDENRSLRRDANAGKLKLYGPSYLEYEDLNKIFSGEKQLIFIHMEINPRCTPEINVTTLGGYSVASAIHIGSHREIKDTYRKLRSWTEQHQLKLKGTAIERNIIDIQTIKDERFHVTEVMLPLAGV